MKSTSHKPKHKRARPIHPLQVVDDHEQRFFRGSLHKQRQSRVTHYELIGRWAVTQTQRHVERRALWWAQVFDVVKEGMQYLIQAGEAEVRLELRTSGTQHAETRIGRMSCHGFQENGLAYSGRSGQHEGAAVGRRLVDERVKEFEVLVASEQQRRDLMG